MSAVKGDPSWIASSPPVLSPRVEVGTWQETPRRRWLRRLFGYTMRRLQLEGDFAPAEVWGYYTPRQAARIILEDKYATWSKVDDTGR